jgi:hypothetical protein
MVMTPAARKPEYPAKESGIRSIPIISWECPSFRPTLLWPTRRTSARALILQSPDDALDLFMQLDRGQARRPTGERGSER